MRALPFSRYPNFQDLILLFAIYGQAQARTAKWVMLIRAYGFEQTQMK